MTLFDFAIRNIIRDKKNYIYYFINCVFSVFVFFLFSVLSFHPALKIIDTHSAMGITLAVGEVISVIFSICFISYSIGSFLKNRSKQLGLITILGASKKQLNKLIFMENIVVGFMAIINGIILGMIFSKFFLDIANKLIGVSEFTFYFPVKAILLTVIIMGLVFYIIAYFTPKFIRKKEIIKLLKAEVKDDKPQKLIPILLVFLILAPISTYIFISKSDWVRSIQENFIFPFVLLSVIVLGTYLLFSYGLRLLIYYQKRSMKNTRLLSIGNQRSKLRTNAQSMTISTILYTISFFAFIILFSMSTNVKSETEKIFPYALTYNAWTENADIKHDLNIIENELKNLSGYKKTDINLYYMNDNSRTAIMSQTDYNKVMLFLNRQTIFLTQKGVYFVAGNTDKRLNQIPNTEFLNNLSIEGQTDEIITLTGFTSGIYVINDYTFNSLMPQLTKKVITAFYYDNWDKNGEAPDNIFKALQNSIDKGDINIVSAYRYYRNTQIQNNLTLYIGSMLSFVFILAVASFIYSRLYSELDTECKKFKGIVKIGLSEKELCVVLNRFTFLILYIPFIVSIIYLWIGVLILEQFSVISNIPIAISFTIILFILQTIIYLWINNSYKENILNKVYNL